MSEFGYKINNYEAGSIYGVMLGMRDKYDYTEAMLTNSLFTDFLLANGLSVKKDTTRDVICLDFNYGTRGAEEELKHLVKRAKEARLQYKIAKSFNSEDTSKKLNARKKIAELYLDVKNNPDKYKKVSKDEIRNIFYNEGVPITYHSKKGDETIVYRMLYRTPGKAKAGKCMFIREKLYKKARNFLYMGIKLKKHNAPIVEIGAYSSLITSTIVGKIRIKPEEILVLNDFDSIFKTNIVAVKTDKEKHCYAETIKDYEVKNTIFDGQGLIDSSVFPEWGDGYILLRHHMCKCAAFNTNLQQFFKDYFTDDYEKTTVKDMWGNEVRVKNIKLVTTDQSMKWVKFDVGFDYWSEWVRKNDCMFGIVKTAHHSKLGNVQRMSYQMINSLSEEIMPNVIDKSIRYIERLKTDDYIFLEYLERTANFSNDHEVLVALVKRNPDFLRSEYYRARKRDIIRAYVLDFKNGRSIQNADNLTIVGSPYAMLLHSVGENPEDDPTFKQEKDSIQCYSERFADGEYLAEFRSPFNSRNNMGYLHNNLHPLIKKYFNLGKLCVAVNMIHTDFQDRNNGSDMDSDSIYTTNQEDIVSHAKYCYLNYPTIVNMIPKEKNHYDNTMDNFASIDNKLAAAQLAIGESSNLAQLSLSYTYNFDDTRYDDYVCILSVVAQAAIDNTKRTFDIDIPNEIRRIKKELGVDESKYPKFFSIVKKNFNYDNVNKKLKCPMNFLYDVEISKVRDSRPPIPMSEFFAPVPLDSDRRKSKQVEKMIEKYSLENYKYQIGEGAEEYLVLQYDFYKMVEEIRAMYISKNYKSLMSWLINRAFLITPEIRNNKGKIKSKLNKNRVILLKTLYTVNSDLFLECFNEKKNCKKIS